jgi:hypothetical protein
VHFVFIFSKELISPIKVFDVFPHQHLVLSV